MKPLYLFIALVFVSICTIAMDAQSLDQSCAAGRMDYSCSELTPNTAFLIKFRRAVVASKYLDEIKGCVKNAKSIGATKACLIKLDQGLSYYFDREVLRRLMTNPVESCLLGSRSCMGLSVERFVAQLDEEAKAEQEQAFDAALDDKRSESETYAKCLEKPEAKQPKCDIDLIKKAGLDKRWPAIAQERLTDLAEELKPTN